MDLVGNFFDKYKRILIKNSDVNKNISETLKEVIGIDFPLSSIKYSEGVIYIKTKPIIKSEILMNKDLIIGKLKEKQPDNIWININ